MNTAPIFILGANRSGTTLLRLMLNAHPRIGIPEELTYFHSMYGEVPLHPWRAPSVTAERYEAIVRTYTTHAHSLHPELDPEALTQSILEAGPPNFREPYRQILSAWARHHGKARWGEKTPGNVFFVDVLHEMFPDAQFLHVVRDPRAGVASMQKVSFFAEDVVFNALVRRKYASSCAAFQEQIPPEQWMTIRYEDLVRTPESTLQAVLGFLGEDYTPQLLHYHQSADRYMRDDAADSFNRQATRPISTASLDKWRSQLSDDEIAVVEAISREEMTRYGYVPQRTRPRWQSRVSMYAKWAYWKLQEWRNREYREYLVRYPMFARLRYRLSQAFGRPARRVLSKLG